MGVRQPRPGAGRRCSGTRAARSRAATPWLPFADDHATVNVEAQRDDPGSLLSLYRRLLALRRSEPDLRDGAYRTLEATDRILRYVRGDSTVVTIDFETGDGSIVKHA